MYSTDTTCGKEANASHTCTEHGSGDGGGSQLTRCQRYRQVAPAYLEHMLRCAQSLDLVFIQANHDFPIMNAYRGGNCALAAYRDFHRPRNLDVGRIGQAMRNDGRFERNNRALLM